MMIGALFVTAGVAYSNITGDAAANAAGWPEKVLDGLLPA